MTQVARASIVDFLFDNHKKWVIKTGSNIGPYLSWHGERGLLTISLCGEDIHGLCTIRIFRDMRDWATPYVFQPDGPFCLVDLLVATSPLGIADCYEQFVKRWGPRPIMLWERGDRTEKRDPPLPPRMYTWKQYVKLTRRLTYGSIGEV